MIMYKKEKLLCESHIGSRGKVDCYLGGVSVRHICWLCGINLVSRFHAIPNSSNVLLRENVSVAKVAPISLALPAEAGLNVVGVLLSMLERQLTILRSASAGRARLISATFATLIF